MPSLDIFSNDAFSLTSLTDAIQNTPYQPSRIGSSGLFVEDGISTLTFGIEKVGSVLSLVPAGVRGQSGVVRANQKRQMIDFRTVHLPQRDAVIADEVQGLRAFGTETEVELVQNVVNTKLSRMRDDLDVTIEWQRIGAIKGQVLDADGSTVLLDLYSTFGVAQQVVDMNLDSDTTKVLLNVVAAKRLIETELGGLMYSGLTAYCSATFFDAFVAHPAVEKAYYQWQQGQFLRTDNRAGFSFGGVEWVEYRGNVSGQDFIEANAAYLVPTGVRSLFLTKYAPADYIETVNTKGLPYYARQYRPDHGKSVELESQSNPISLCTRPRAIIKLVKT